MQGRGEAGMCRAGDVQGRGEAGMRQEWAELGLGSHL